MTESLSSFFDVVAGKTYETLGPVDRVINATESYIVYVAGNEVHYAESEDHFSTDEIKTFNELWMRAMELQSRPRHNLTPAEQSYGLTMVANAIGTALEKDFDGATKMLDQCSVLIQSTSTRRAVNWYAASIAVLGLAIVTVALLYLVWRGTVTGMTEVVETIVSVALGGTVGTLLWGLILKNRTETVDPYATRPWILFSGVIRVIVGLLGAFVVVLCARIGLVTSEFIDDKAPFWGYVIFAVAGGFSERWAPLLISRIGPASDEEDPAENGE